MATLRIVVSIALLAGDRQVSTLEATAVRLARTQCCGREVGHREQGARTGPRYRIIAIASNLNAMYFQLTTLAVRASP
jgi:hypothetical protein